MRINYFLLDYIFIIFLAGIAMLLWMLPVNNSYAFLIESFLLILVFAAIIHSIRSKELLDQEKFDKIHKQLERNHNINDSVIEISHSFKNLSQKINQNETITKKGMDAVNLHTSNKISNLEKLYVNLFSKLIEAERKLVENNTRILNKEKEFENYFRQLLSNIEELEKKVELKLIQSTNNQQLIAKDLETITKKGVDAVKLHTSNKISDLEKLYVNLFSKLTESERKLVKNNARTLNKEEEFENYFGQLLSNIEELEKKVESKLIQPTNNHQLIAEYLKTSNDIILNEKEKLETIIHQSRENNKAINENKTDLTFLSDKQAELFNEIHKNEKVLENIKINVLGNRFTKPPIIIGGCGRSGTTLLLSILSAHPEIYAIDKETEVFCPTIWTENIDFNAPFNLEKLLTHITSPKITHKRWLEKSPNNIHFFERILDQLGEVKLIQIVRDGRDVILSKHPKSPDQFWVTPERWVNSVKAGISYENHPAIYTIRYEDLVLNHNKTVQLLCSFLDIDNNSYMNNWTRYATIRQDIAWFEGIKPIYEKSIGKWKKPENEERVHELLQNNEAIHLLKRYKYI